MQNNDNIPSILTSRFETEMAHSSTASPSRRLSGLVLVLAVVVIIALTTIMLS